MTLFRPLTSICLIILIPYQTHFSPYQVDFVADILYKVALKSPKLLTNHDDKWHDIYIDKKLCVDNIFLSFQITHNAKISGY